ncbi:LpqN/LpqT family lipoprotein [Mycobacterium camsae]|uniref:LpqN/LpqT family lipoprotein n=1 Tax=Mycobacterium gordonae TaxID=1778 RepID=UPI00197E3582|nr:LpqN/LpqT family lipoprotein [Mycobacterium gordonae]
MTVKAIRVCVTAVGVAALTVACGPKTADYQSIWTTPSTASSTSPKPTEPPVPLSKYLEGEGVLGDAVLPSDLSDMVVSIPTPAGWKPRAVDSKTSPKAVMISKGDSYPAAMLVVFKLRGEFNPAEAIKHANADLPDSFHELDASTADYNGFPSSMVQGTYELKGARMRSWNRVVLPTGPAPDNQRYLVQLIITSLAEQAVAESNDVEAIIRGFVVARK